MNNKTTSGLQDPLRDFAPAASRVHADARLILLAIVLLVVIGAWIRLRRTDPDETDYAPRRDMACLLSLVWAGLGVEWIRSRFDLATLGFWIATLALLPFVVGAVALGLRLIGAYRAESSVPPPAASRPKAGRR